MAAQKEAREILIATRNPGKYREIVAVLSEPLPDHFAVTVHWRSLGELADEIEEPVEDQATFAANAAIKARHYSRASGLWTLADDSGLEVDALGGAPGVFSARFAQVDANRSRKAIELANNRKLVAVLSQIPQEARSARFRCALALADGDRILAMAEGTIEGLIIDTPRGSHGFGYDPHFFVPKLGKTTAELSPDHKNRISHRGQALRRMRRLLSTRLSSP